MDIVQRNEHVGITDSSQLVDRMDSAIGDASTSIGMIMSELVRRSLRGGVSELGVSLHSFAREQVHEAVVEKMPQIEKTVETLAESTSSRIVDGAVLRFGEELKSVESRTTEQTEIIAARFKADSEAALQTVHKVLDESRETTERTAVDLKELQDRAKESWRKVQTELQSANERRVRLEEQLRETEQRLTNSQSQIAELQQLIEKAAQTQKQTNQHLQETRSHLTETAHSLQQSQGKLTATQQELATTQQELTATQRSLKELGLVSTKQSQSLEALCLSLEKRLAELERPRGIRALFSRFSGRKGASESNETSGEES